MDVHHAQAADFLRRFDSTQEQDAIVYFNDMNSKDTAVPPRAGYSHERRSLTFSTVR